VLAAFPRSRKTTVAPTTLSSLSVVLTLVAVFAAAWTSPEPWRPQPLLASANRPKFPFGGKRREPAEPESTEPDMLDEVAGGRYGGGQTLLPALGAAGETSTKLPRLFPDPDAPTDEVDDEGFDDDLLAWTPESDDDDIAPVGLVPPPPPAATAPVEPGWPLEMGMLEAIVNMQPDPAGVTDSDDEAAADADTWAWARTPHGGEPATSPFPLDPTTPAPFGDLAPVEPWELAPADDTSTTAWDLVPADEPSSVSWLSTPEPEPVADVDPGSWDSFAPRSDASALDTPEVAHEESAPAWGAPAWEAPGGTTFDETPGDADAASTDWLHDPTVGAAADEPIATEPVPAADVVESSWSDIFDIFQGDDDPPSTLDAAPDTIAELADGPQDDATPAAGDQWASTLLDRLRAVVATPGEPAEALDEFNLRFARGLRLRLTNEQVVQYLGQGVHLIAPEAEAQVLLATHGAELDERAAVGQGTRPGCGVTHADLCPAVVQGETLHFDNSTFLDACPHLSDRPTGACAAVCVPLERTGDVAGVVHITTLLNAALPPETVDAIEHAVQEVSVRIVELRASRRTDAPDDRLHSSVEA